MHYDPEEIIAGEISFMSRRLEQTYGKYFGSEVWVPAINLYQTPNKLELCMDLSGVDRNDLDIQIEPKKLKISGYRHAPHPPAPCQSSLEGDKNKDFKENNEPMKIVCMEIDYGSFSRIITIPKNVDLKKVQSKYRDGMLWVTMPLI